MPTSIIAAAAVAGVGLSGFSMYKQTQAAKKEADAQKAEIAAQQAAEAQRQQQMQLQAKRNDLEILRNAQRARALGLNNAANQGAQYGSGIQGGYGQISGESNTQRVSQFQNLEIGQNIFADNASLSQDKINYASAQSDFQTWGAVSQLGSTLVSNAKSIGAIGGSMLPNKWPGLPPVGFNSPWK